MNKKEISEIKRILSKDHCRVDRIAGCYVGNEKQKIMTMREAFLSLPDEEVHKYCDLLKKALSGTIGRQLHTLEFPIAEEAEDGKQTALLALRDSHLQDDEQTNALYDRIIESFEYTGSYLILLASGSYDIPARGTDRMEQFDASEYVYTFVAGAICPVTLSKAGLCYDADSNTFIDKLQDHMVDPPEIGFLFPAFHDRNTDIHATLYHVKNPAQLHPEFSEGIFGAPVPLTAQSQRLTFNETVEDVFGRDCSFEVAKTIHESLHTMINEHKDDPDPAVLESSDVATLLTSCGAEQETVENWKTSEKESGEDLKLVASNLTAGNRFEVTSPDVKISVRADRTDLINTRIINGEEFIVIPLTGEVEVNGLRIRQTRTDEDDA
jgi:hypothetical protein